MKKLYAVVWTDRNHRIVPTKQAATDQMRTWKESYRGRGWHVRASGKDAYIAASPDGERHAITLHVYDAATRERLA